MSILDTIGRVVMKVDYKVDEAKAALKGLSGVEREVAQARVEQLEAANEAQEKQIKTLGKVQGAIGLLGQAASFVWDGYKLGIERARLESAAMGANIDKLRSASLGLKSTTDLLRDAAKLQSGEFKLTSDQMAATESAMVALNRKFNDGGEASKKLMQAVTELKADALLELGIPIDKAGLSMEKASDRAEIFRRVMEKVGEVGKTVKEGQLAAGESMEQATVKLADSWDKLKISIGQLATAFEPLLRAVSSIIDKISADFPAAINKYVGEKERGLEAMRSGQYGNFRDGNVGYEGPLYESFQKNRGWTTNDQFAPASTNGRSFAEAASSARSIALTDEQKAAIKDRRDRLAKALLEQADRLIEEVKLDDERAANQINVDALDTGRAGSDILAMLAQGRKGLAGFENQATAGDRYDAANTARGKGQLEKIFGPVGEFDIYAKAFETLSGAVGSALGAWIDGSKSAGDAFKSFIGESVKAIAVQMAMESLKEGAFAIGSLARYDYPGAAAHGKAALMFAAGAAVASGAARALHSSGGGASVGGGGGYSPGAPYSGSSGPGGGGTHTTIVVQDPWGEATGRQRASNLRRTAERAIGSSAGYDR